MGCNQCRRDKLKELIFEPSNGYMGDAVNVLQLDRLIGQ